MSIEDKLTAVAENQQKVYDAGHEAGAKSEYDRFWDTFQKNGQPANYQYAFGRNRFDDTNYNPKDPIVCDTTSGSAGAMYYASSITDTKVSIDLTRITIASATSGMFNYAYYLKTIRKLIVSETTPNISIYECPHIVNITIEGTYASNFDAGGCKELTRESMISVLNSLSTTATGKTVTFSKVAKEAAFTAAEWTALEAAHPNWTIALA